MTRTSSLTIGLAVIISASGCAQMDALEAYGLELRDARLAREARGAAPRPQSGQDDGETCQPFDFVANKDVDTAYAIAMSKFGFRTVEERKRVAEFGSIGIVDEGFKHVAQAGAYYRMSDRTRIPGYKGTWTDMELIKSGPTRTTVRGDVCEWGAPRSRARQAALVSALKARF